MHRGWENKYKYFVEIKSIAVSEGMERYMSVALKKGIMLKQMGSRGCASSTHSSSTTSICSTASQSSLHSEVSDTT